MDFPEITLKKFFIVVIPIVVIILHYIPTAMEVTLHLLTSRVSFAFPIKEDATAITIIESLPIDSLHLSGNIELTMNLKEIKELERPLTDPQSHVLLKPMIGREAQISFRGEGLRIMYIRVANNATVELENDQRNNLIMQIRHFRMLEILLVVSETYAMTVQNMELRDQNGEIIPWKSSKQIHTLVVSPAFPLLNFAQDHGSINLIMNFSRQLGRASLSTTSLSFSPRLKVSHLDFTREAAGQSISTIQQFWANPIIPQGQAQKGMYLELPKNDAFILQSVSLSGKGMEIVLSGRTAKIMTGETKPLTNRMPSLLLSLQYNEPWATIIKFLKAMIT